jgi:hypothetical protein
LKNVTFTNYAAVFWRISMNDYYEDFEIEDDEDVDEEDEYDFKLDPQWGNYDKKD